MRARSKERSLLGQHCLICFFQIGIEMFNLPANGLRAALKQYFGFESFRPLQEEIVRDALAGKDVLPCSRRVAVSRLLSSSALVRPGLTVVVSPLIC